jgi:hypothetical protein
MSNVKLDKASGQVTFMREFQISPFFLNVFPQQRKRFCTVLVVSPDSPALSKLFKFSLNCYPAEPTPPSFTSTEDLFSVPREFTDRSKTEAELKGKLLLVDMSKNGCFSQLDPAIRPFRQDGAPTWLRNHHIRSTLQPNLILPMASTGGDWDKNYSHTIWLVPSVEEIPKVLMTNGHLFLVDKEHINAFFKTRLGLEAVNQEDCVLAVSSLLKQDIQLMTMARERFLPPQVTA